MGYKNAAIWHGIDNDTMLVGESFKRLGAARWNHTILAYELPQTYYYINLIDF